MQERAFQQGAVISLDHNATLAYEAIRHGLFKVIGRSCKIAEIQIEEIPGTDSYKVEATLPILAQCVEAIFELAPQQENLRWNHRITFIYAGKQHCIHFSPSGVPGREHLYFELLDLQSQVA